MLSNSLSSTGSIGLIALITEAFWLYRNEGILPKRSKPRAFTQIRFLRDWTTVIEQRCKAGKGGERAQVWQARGPGSALPGDALVRTLRPVVGGHLQVFI